MENAAQNTNRLLVYQKAKKLALKTIAHFGCSKKFDKHYFLVNQLLRSSSSIGANIAEGFGRASKKSFRQFLLISRGSVFETEFWLDLAKEMKLLDTQEHTALVSLNQEVGKMLTTLVKRLEVGQKK